MESIKINWRKFNSITIEKYQDGYFITPHTMRPKNAPYGRVTNADFVRKTRESKITYKLSKMRKLFNADEVLDIIDCLSKISK